MRVTTCTINVGRGEGNRTMIMEVLSLVDIFFILDPPVERNGGNVENEVEVFELFSFVKGSGVEVFVRTGLVGWMEMVEHNENICKIKMRNGQKEMVIGGTYWRPGKSVKEIERWMENMEDCNVVKGDFNARNPKWGKKSGDTTTNVYGRQLEKWIEKKGYEIHEHHEKTFRQTSTIDLAVYRTNEKYNVKTTDKTGIEHKGLIGRHTITKLENQTKGNIAWKKVDWKKVEKEIEEIGKMEVEERWNGMKEMVNGMERVKMGKRKAEWWDDELEKLAKDLKSMRRSKNEGWSTCRKIFRNTLIKRRYESMRDRLEKTRDPEMFEMIKQLEGKRSLPPMTDDNGNITYDHEGIGDLIAAQLNPIKAIEWTKQEKPIEVEISEDDVETALKESPRNTASGIDQMSYPLLRLWFKKDRKSATETFEYLLRYGCEDWHSAETVLIKKGDKERYDVVKSWRMIHLLPTMAKTAERIVLKKIAHHVRLEETQYRSRKNRSTHDAMKQMMEFLEHNKYLERGIVSMDVEGGFDKVDIDILSDIMSYRECPIELIE